MKRINSIFCLVLLFLCLLGAVFIGEIGFREEKTSAKAAEGSKKIAVPMQMYNPDENVGFTLTNAVSKTVFGSSAYTSLSICVDDGEIVESKHNGLKAYGVTGTAVSLRFKVNYSAEINQEIAAGAFLCGDTWGKEKGETINGVEAGWVQSGAVVVQTSKNGKTWSNENKAKYTEGLYSTDYYTHYKTNPQTIYLPDGNEISQGIYIRVLYVYEIYYKVDCVHPKKFLGIKTGRYKHSYDREHYNYVEAYSFYLCQNSAQSVTFHNLSAKGVIEDNLKDEDASLVEIIKQTETLVDGSVTTKGFYIDKSKNQSASVTVKKDLQEENVHEVFSQEPITTAGRYDITVKTALGEESTTTIYVLNNDKENLYLKYFGENFLTGKRIYSEGLLPVYEAGSAKLGNSGEYLPCEYNLQDAGACYPYLWGSITNKTTGKVISVNDDNAGCSEMLFEAGEYEAVFNTNGTFHTENPVGDNHKFVFRFRLIENGTAPGPKINKDNLDAFSRAYNPSNLHATYYGVTFSSAGSGGITLAFSNQKAAVEFAYNYEKGMVEVQKDGSFRYAGSLQVSQKVKYESAWTLTDALYYFAEQAVQKLRFDLSDQFTYRTLQDDDIAAVENLRALELPHSVVIFANESERESLLVSSSLPVINSQVFAYLDLQEDDIKSGLNPFVFIKDKNGYESNRITVFDSEGTEFNIEYGISVEEQLEEKGCKTGIITIAESTCYGDTAIYQAIYIAKGNNTAEIELGCYENGREVIREINQGNVKADPITVDAFSVKSIKDAYDAYGTVIINKANGEKEQGFEEYYCYDEQIDRVYTKKGSYTVTLLNRWGYAYSFGILIEEEVYYTAQWSGEGTEDLRFLMYTEQETITLPKLEKKGYRFVGFKAVDGNVYSGTVEASVLMGSPLLEAVWVKETNWLTVVATSVASLLMMLVAHVVITKGIKSKYASWMWVVCIMALTSLLVFVSLPWWALLLIEIGAIWLMVAFILVVEKY